MSAGDSLRGASRWAMVGLAVALLFSTKALAEETPPAEDGDAFARAREHFEQGLRLSQEELWAPALALFDESLRLHPTQAALFNRGLCLKFLGRYPEAIEAFERLLERHGEEIDAERRARVETELEGLRGLVGRIVIRLERPGAQVSVDGAVVGTTPLDGPIVLTAGQHLVEVRADGFQPLERPVTIVGGGQVTIEPSLAVTEAPGTLRIAVSVPAATVSIDGERVGETPLRNAVPVDVGTHVVSAARPGYEPAQAEVAIASGEAAHVELDLEPLSPLPMEVAGDLDVHVSERGATVLVDGEPLGEGPVPVGPHRLEVVLEGYAPWSRMVDVVSARPTFVEAALHPDAPRRARYRSRAMGVRIASFVMFGLAAGALASALGVFLWNDARHSDDYEPEVEALQSAYSTGAWVTSPGDEELWSRVVANEELGDSIRSYDYIAAGLLGGGLTAAVIATIMILAGPDPDRYTTVSVVPRDGGLALSLGGVLP